MKNLQKLHGAKILGKKEQQSITGGAIQEICDEPCPNGNCCIGGLCGAIGHDGQCVPI